MGDTMPVTAEGDNRVPGARLALSLLLAINLFNYIDRQVLAAVQPSIEKQFGRSKAEMGMLASMFLVSYMFFAPVFGWLGDRFARWFLVGIGVIVWSLASGGTGLAETFGILLLTRALVGVGEGAYGPVAPTLIADMYPVEHRGAKLAWFYVAIPVGSALGYVLGGLMSDRFGWQYAFYAVVPPGILLGILCFFMREPARGAADGVIHRRAKWSDYRVLLRTRSFVLCSLGMTAMTFTLGGVAIWIPTYYYERESYYRITTASYEEMRTQIAPPPDRILEALAPVMKFFSVEPNVPTIPTAIIAKLEPLESREFHSMDAFRAGLSEILDPREMTLYRTKIGGAARDKEKSEAHGASEGQIGWKFGLIVVISGLIATLAGGWLGDRLRPRFGGSYFLVSGVGMLIGFPFFLLAVEAPLPWGWWFTGIAVFFLFFNTGPTNTILANVTHPAMRSTAFAVNIFVLHLLGDVASPPIVGWIDGFASLRWGMFVLSGSILISGVLWLWGARYLERDTARAPTRL
ncbi:MAG: spinster family MFS transporter [Gemmataceae bacterium]